MSNTVIDNKTIEDAFYNGFIEEKVNITVDNELVGFNLLPLHAITREDFSKIGSGEIPDGFIEAAETEITQITRGKRMTWFYFIHQDEWDYDPWYLYWFGDNN